VVWLEVALLKESDPYFLDANIPLIMIKNIPKAVCHSINSSSQTTPIIVEKIIVK
tara:strand:+ start:552 stop:716 length:165 start_codon:yes stop_codon:yes gene_type:complete